MGCYLPRVDRARHQGIGNRRKGSSARTRKLSICLPVQRDYLYIIVRDLYGALPDLVGYVPNLTHLSIDAYRYICILEVMQ